MIYPITPMGKPRMTQRDKWKKRAVVLRYFSFKDQVRLHKVEIPHIPKIVFHVPMPPSWSEKKKAAHDGKPHLARPDLDNLAKSVSDSVYEEDSHIWCMWAEKRWARVGAIEIVSLDKVPC